MAQSDDYQHGLPEEWLDRQRDGDMPRKRPLEDYLKKLQINKTIWESLNNTGIKILLIGGGIGEIQSKSKAEFTNIDMGNPMKDMTHNCTTYIQGDFTKTKISANSYREVWSLWGLPSYAKTEQQIKIFYALAMLALEPGGRLRVYPLKSYYGLDPDAGLDDMRNLGIRVGEFCNMTWGTTLYAPSDKFKKADLNIKLKNYLTEQGYEFDQIESDKIAQAIMKENLERYPD
jgi:hypothetical protein